MAEVWRVEALVHYPRVGEGTAEEFVNAALEVAGAEGKVVGGRFIGSWRKGDWGIEVDVFTIVVEQDVEGLTRSQVEHAIQALACVIVQDSDAEVLGTNLLERVR